jgi:hypothetical protein
MWARTWSLAWARNLISIFAEEDARSKSGVLASRKVAA